MENLTPCPDSSALPFQRWQLALWRIIETSTSPFPSSSPPCFDFLLLLFPKLSSVWPSVHSGRRPQASLSPLSVSPPSLLRLFPSPCLLLKCMWRFSGSISVQALSPVRQRGFISLSPRRPPPSPCCFYRPPPPAERRHPRLPWYL